MGGNAQLLVDGWPVDGDGDDGDDGLICLVVWCREVVGAQCVDGHLVYRGDWRWLFLYLAFVLNTTLIVPLFLFTR